MNVEEKLDHRTRVAAERREKTRSRLLDSALLVFGQKGPQAVVDDVIAHAGMARGSFYNYFRTNEELLVAVAREISNDLMRAIDPVALRDDDPAARVACGTRLLLHAVTRYSLFGTFVSRLPYPTANSGLIGFHFLVRDVAEGIRTRRFRRAGLRPASDLVIGVVLSSAYSAALEPAEAGYPEAMARMILRGLGLGEAEAARVANRPLPELVLPPTSILARAREP